MTHTPLAQLSRDEVQDLVRVHAMMFAYLRYLRANPDHEEERADTFAERNWHQFRDMALDYLALSFALAERDAAAPWN